jgi:hypothetical protein
MAYDVWISDTANGIESSFGNICERAEEALEVGNRESYYIHLTRARMMHAQLRELLKVADELGFAPPKMDEAISSEPELPDLPDIGDIE